MNQFWQKFKHRNVAKVAAAYAALSWVLLQAQEAVPLDQFGHHKVGPPTAQFVRSHTLGADSDFR